MAVVNNVRLVLLPAGAPANEAIGAPNQQVYIDLTAGTMTRVQTNAAGTIVGVPPAPAAVSLDDTRDYHVVVSPTALPVAPAASGATVRVSGGRLAVPPHIAVKITRSAGGAAASLACVLKIGGVDTNITTTAAGWLMSNNKSAGEVMVRCNTALLKAAAAANPAATLAIAPTSPVARGTNATITITPPAGTAGFKVTEWKYDISHTNPGPVATARPVTATVTRPATESAATFDQNWQGVICAAGTVKAKFVVGAVVRASGDTAVSAALQAVDPVEVTLAVNVSARTGAAWTATLTEKPVEDLVRPINSFQDVGQHGWDVSVPALPNATSVADGPNRGCAFLPSAAATFTSTPRINKLLSDATSAFSLAQDKARLTAPAPIRVIPRNLYTVGAGGTITETPPGSIATHFSIQGQFMTTRHMIDQPTLLAGTRRHEFEDPGQISHKGNCKKALRALEPVQFAEALVRVPGASLNFTQLFQARVTMVVNVGATHNVVDETQTQTDHQARFIAGQQILDVNADSNGNMVAPVWNPTTNQMLQ